MVGIMTETTAPRSWAYFAGRPETDAQKTPKGEKHYIHLSPWREALAFSGVAGKDILSVDLVEDAEGEYLGWIETGEDVVSMVTIDRIFSIQFPYGVEAAVKAGDGELIRLSVKEK
jgi:hypothetical protein